ncbi:hypothetical protein CPB86DRAFT_870493 [Serendipita vermifera]|nr:hypothetical protein CPB86DRAFT_870493 [Serendipita vermifera]
MDHSNEILFNSPALHSLKRAQLTALCKRYHIKTTGKNEDLVARLREYATTSLNKKGEPDKKDTSSVPQEENDASNEKESAGRTSQQWELVEEDSREEDMSVLSDRRSRTISAISIGTIKSIGSSKGSTMRSVSSRGNGNMSLMSITNSLKRAGSRSSKMSTSTTKTSSTVESIVKEPMSHLFPIVPSDSAASTQVDSGSKSEVTSEVAPKNDAPKPIIESMVDATTVSKQQSTVRLVTPAAARQKSTLREVAFPTPILRPYSIIVTDTDPQEDIGRAFLAIDAKSLAETASVQIDAPRTSFDSLRGFQFPQSNTSIVLSEDNTNTTPKKEADNLAPSPQLFIFGSPANGVSNAQFSNTAAAILEEMNKRLGIENNSSAAARIEVDGAINFGETTPSREFALKVGNKREDNGRFAKAHEKLFSQMDSIADHYSVKRPVPTIGSKRKSTVAFGEEGVPKKPQGIKRTVSSETKDSVVPPPPSKRQKVDGATLAEMEQKNKATSTVAKVATKEQDETAKKMMRTQQRRRSSKGRLSAGGPAARAKAVTAAKAAPTSRFGLIRSGAAKVMKSIISSVAGTTQPSSSKPIGPSVATTSKSQPKPPVKMPQKQSASASARPAPIVEEPSKVKGDTKSSKATLASEVATRKTRESNLAPRASSNDVSGCSSLISGTRATKTTLAPKASAPPKFTRTSTGPRRGALPSFEDPKKSAPTEETGSKAGAKNSGSTTRVSSISNRPSGTVTRPKLTVRNNRISGAKTTPSDSISNTKSASARSSLATASQTRRASKPATRETSVSSKVELQSVPEARNQPDETTDNRDFEPAMSRNIHDFDDSRASSPLPTPPASLSSKPLQRRKPLEPVQPSDEVVTDGGNGSLGRKPRISRSKVIARVHASRQNPGTSGSITPKKPRKSAGSGLTAKAKLMGGETATKARASAAADAAKRRMRLSEAAAARRRTMAKI